MGNLVITIARSYGSGGRQVGRLIASKLGISYFDRNLLREASNDSGISETMFGLNDEKLKAKLFRKKPDLNEKPLAPDDEKYVSDANLFNFQASTIRSIAERESCVIVGRCADYILKDHDNLVRVFIYADKDACVQTVMGRYGVSAKEAEKIIEETDKERRAYHKYYTDMDWDEPRNYDLCINTAQIGENGAVELIEKYIDIRKS